MPNASITPTPLPSQSEHSFPPASLPSAFALSHESNLNTGPSLFSAPSENADTNQTVLAIRSAHVTEPHIPQTQPTSPYLQRDLWDEALQTLSERDKLIVLEHVPSETTHLDVMLEALMKEAQDKRRACEAKCWTLEVKGHVFELHRVADKVFDWLNKIKQIGDIVVNVDPLHAGVPWAGIRLLLQVRSFQIQSETPFYLGSQFLTHS